jgi:site-specific recombinase XerD
LATDLLVSGVSIFQIRRLLGHADIQTTMVYLHVQQSYLDSIVASLDMLEPETSCLERYRDQTP